MGKKWLPLESNPEVMADFAHADPFNHHRHSLGLPKEMGFHDIFGFDPDLLAMVPQPCHAVLLLFPITDASEKAKDTEAAEIQANGQDVSENVWYTRQTIGNACGTIGVLHAVGNNLNEYSIDPDSWFGKFFQATRSMTPEQRASHLETDDSLEAAHSSAVSSGTTECPTVDDEVNLHFVALVHVDGGLYELDGRKNTAVRHGDTTAESLLQDSVPVIKKFIETSEGSVSFNAIALAPGGSMFD